MILSRCHGNPLVWKYSSVSARVKGCKGISWVIRSCRPPWLSITLRTIHDVALPHIISIISDCQLAQLFQKCPRAFTKPALGVSRHGSSSINIRQRLPGVIFSASSWRRATKASIQLVFFLPLYPFNFIAAWKAVICSALLPSSTPVKVKLSIESLTDKKSLSHTSSAIESHKLGFARMVVSIQQVKFLLSTDDIDCCHIARFRLKLCFWRC